MARQARKTTREGSGRNGRTILGRGTQKMQVAPIEGYNQHWFNDTDGRIQEAQDAGYEFVTRTEGEREVHKTMRVGVSDDGTPLNAVLMKIREDWHEEDKAEKAKENDLIDEAIKAGKPAGGSQEPGAFYDGGSSLKSGTT